MDRKNVVVTGMGVISALGSDLVAFSSGLRAGRCGIGKLTLFDAAGSRSELVGQAPEPELPELAAALPAHTSRPDRFGLRAALSAVADAGLGRRELDHAAVLFGIGTGGAAETEDYLRELLDEQRDELPPATRLIAHQPAAVTDLVARALAAGGPRSTIMTACSSSAIAISQALDLITLGRAEVALAGGAEGLCRLTYAGFNALRATSPERCRPFDVNRKGLNLGEGAAVLVLESEEHARRRGYDLLTRPAVSPQYLRCAASTATGSDGDTGISGSDQTLFGGMTRQSPYNCKSDPTICATLGPTFVCDMTQGCCQDEPPGFCRKTADCVNAEQSHIIQIDLGKCRKTRRRTARHASMSAWKKSGAGGN